MVAGIGNCDEVGVIIILCLLFHHLAIALAQPYLNTVWNSTCIQVYTCIQVHVYKYISTCFNER